MSAAPAVKIAHTVPGRARLSAPVLAWHRELATRIAHRLAEDAEKVTVRVATGSVIVEDPGRALDPAKLAKKLAELLAAERDEEGRPLRELSPDEHPGPTRVARAVVRAAAGVNADVRAALDDRADLGTILPVIFAMCGLAEVSTTGKMPTPTWFNLLWWSLRSFMTFNIQAVEEQVHPGNGRHGSAFTEEI